VSIKTASCVSAPTPLTQGAWVIFCAVVDNYGDIGVCWRLARQLVREHGIAVNLLVDDWDTTLEFLGRQDAGLLLQTEEQGVYVCHWCDQMDWHAMVSSASVVIEAFGCTLPDAAIAEMAAMTEQPSKAVKGKAVKEKAGKEKATAEPYWLNLEYLSAETWVENYHGQHSLQSLADSHRLPSSKMLSKTFFFPGFTAATGGLLRERDLLAQHESWQADPSQSRAELLQTLNIDTRDLAVGWHDRALLVSLFVYSRPAGGPALVSWFAAMAEASEPALCLVPTGALLTDVAHALGQIQIPVVGDVLRMGSLSVAVIPFLPLDDYDWLLSVCDLNLVRGEDSFVRAQWAGKPLVWHIYPQPGDAHTAKLEAFLARYGEAGQSVPGSDALLEFNRFWNLDADCRKLWHDLRPQLPDLTHRARNWQQKLAEVPDLASSLMQFYRDRR